MSSTARKPRTNRTSEPAGTRGPSKEDVDTMCGFPPFYPACLQPCGSIGYFAAFYSMAALITSTLIVYVNSQVTTLERQFGFSSRQTGLIMAANDIGYLIFVMGVSYTASRMHIPRSLGTTTVIFGVSGLICSLPHFIYGSSSPDVTTNDDATSSAAPKMTSGRSVFGDLCSEGNHTEDSCGVNLTSGEPRKNMVGVDSANVGQVSLAIIVLGMVFQGLAKTPRYSFTVTYTDNNTKRVNTGFYMGIITTFGIFGPALAFLMGGVFSKIYVTLEETDLDPSHPKWIGAWWLGFLFFGSAAILASLPLFCFPRRLARGPNDLDQENNSSKEGGANNNTMSQAPPPVYKGAVNRRSGLAGSRLDKILSYSKDFLQTLIRLWTNPIYLSLVVSSCFIMFTVGGTSAYSPKYLETVFHLPAWKANYILAGTTLCAASLGTFAGGYLSKRLKMTAMSALKFVIASVGLSLLCSAAGFIFKCDQPYVYHSPGSLAECQNNCQCQDNSYFPVCGQNLMTYYSPCAAGCTEQEQGIYTNCSCITGGSAVRGFCDYSCDHLYPYAIFAALRSLFGTFAIIPKLVVLIRCVRNEDKSLAIGFSSFMSSMLGWMLGPIVFGNIIDGMCTIWDVTCGVHGRCLLYDNDLFRLKLHGYACVAFSCSAIVLILAYVYARCTGILDEEGSKGKGPADNHDDKQQMKMTARADDGDSDDDGGDNRNELVA